jgi:hypothetical protein
MCTTTTSTLTLTSLLHDPLVQLANQRDKVCQRDYASMLYRVQESLASRAFEQDHGLELVH